MKSRPDPADASGMYLLADVGLPSSVMLFTATVAVGVVLIALNALAVELDYARRWTALESEVKALREKQAERLRTMRLKRR